jgi:MinD superfamily P-loop ATPase
LIITEPTLSGKHDLGRVADLTASFGILTLLCINKSDLNRDLTGRIAEEAVNRGIKLAGKIRYDKAFTKAQIMKATVIEYTGGWVSEEIKALWRNVVYALG